MAGRSAQKLCVAATLALLLVGQQAAGAREAQAKPGAIIARELAVEASTDSIVLPSGPLGRLLVTPCRSCAPMNIETDSDTKYFFGDREVPLAELRRLLAGQRGKAAVVLYGRDNRRLTRLLVTP
jgi:hypothetical protein